MSPLDIQKLMKRRGQLQVIIKEQHAMKKDKRDPRLIEDVHKRLDKIEEWLGIKKASRVPKVKIQPVSKNEFKKVLNDLLGTQDPKEVMTIDTVDELRVAWPKIRGRNIQISAPREVLAEARRLQRKDLINKRKR